MPTANDELNDACVDVIRRAWVNHYRIEPDAKNDRAIAAMAEQWGEVIGDTIPPHRLMEIYVLTLREAKDPKTGRRSHYFPTAQSLLDQWDVYAEEAAHASFATKSKAPELRMIDGVVLYNCPHCQDQTEQPVWQHTRLGWYRASRGCSCSATPANRRTTQAIERSEYEAAGFVLSECGAWACDEIERRWVKLVELQNNKPPTVDWVVLKTALREERVEV